MIGIYDDTGNRLPMTYRAFEVNNDIYPVGIVGLDHQWDSVIEPKAQQDGMEMYPARRMTTMWRLEGVIKGDSTAELHDSIEAINAAFDPVLAAQDDDESGLMPFAFSVPTKSPSYANGLIPMQIYVRAVSVPVPRISKFEGDAARFTLLLQAADPRRYLQTQSSVSVQSATSVSMPNGLASYRSWPIVTLTLSGAGQSQLNVNRTHAGKTNSTRIQTTGLGNGDVVEIDMLRREIRVNGEVDMSRYIAGTYWDVGVGANTFFLVNVGGTFAGTATCRWRRAFV